MFALVVRPWYRHWGATREEARAPLPGDGMIPGAIAQQTRAITIHANVSRVWPWLAQLGQDRGGFYSYDLLENLVGCRMPTTDQLRPDRQAWRLGDRLWMYPKQGAGGVGFATLRAFVPGRALGFSSRAIGTPLTAPEDGSWTLVLVPLDASHTRLLTRGRTAGPRSAIAIAFDRAVMDPAHFVMERRMMIGIAQLAEGRSRGRLLNHAQVALWAIAFAEFVAAGVMVMRRRLWLVPLAGLLAAAAVFQYLTFGQPAIALGMLLVTVVGALLAWPEPPGMPVSDSPALGESLLDRALATWDARRVERRVIDVPGVIVYRAALDTDLLEVARESLAVRTLFGLRAAWERALGALRGRRPPAAPEPSRMRLADIADAGTWVRLGENPPDEFSFGAIGRFWAGETTWRELQAHEFERFDSPGFAKIACHLALATRRDGATVITYEARTRATDRASRRAFRRYWLLVSPFVGVVMRSLLAAVARNAECADRDARSRVTGADAAAAVDSREGGDLPEPHTKPLARTGPPGAA